MSGGYLVRMANGGNSDDFGFWGPPSGKPHGSVAQVVVPVTGISGCTEGVVATYVVLYCYDRWQTRCPRDRSRSGEGREQTLLNTSRILRSAGLVVILATAGYWLFADTVRRHVGAAPSNDLIRFCYWGGFDDHGMWGEVVAAFESRHPGARVKREWLPLSGYSTKMDQQFVAETAPDVIMFQDEPFPRYADEQFMDLTPLLAEAPATRARLDDCWPSAVSSFQHEGSLRGLPIMGGNVLIYCNLDAFERAGRFHDEPIEPPRDGWTLDEFVALCRRLTFDDNGDGRTDQFGLLQPHWVYYLPFIWSQGAALLNEQRTRWTLRGPEAVASFEMYANLRHRWGVTPMPIEYAGQNSDTAFLSGRVAMCVNGPWFQAFLRETRLRDRYCVVDIPRGPGGSQTRVTWDALCIYAKAPAARRTGAWRFARFVLTTEAQSIFAAHQRAIPARRACADVYIRESGGVDSAASAFVTAMREARRQPITSDWHVMSRAMRRHLTSVILDGDGRCTPTDAIDALASDRGIKATFGGR